MTSLEADRIIAGRYRLERPLASGGMGSVWVARHQQLDISVAIKFMAPECTSSADARARFDREAKASARFKNRNVVQVHDYGIDDDTPYLVMELLEGEDLAARLKREGRLGPVATAVILVQACKALRRAHEAGLVHRDVKPGNLFLSRQDEEEVLKILDFGIVKATGTILAGATTENRGFLGSPHYMSPEQVREDRRIDHRSDLWSLGVIAFRCLTGKLPFPGEMLVDVVMSICMDRIPVASQIAPDLPPEVDRFFQRALARDPDKRFQSAREFAEALSRIAGVSGQPLGRAEMWSLSSASDAPVVPVMPVVPVAPVMPVVPVTSVAPAAATDSVAPADAMAPTDAAEEDTPTERCRWRPFVAPSGYAPPPFIVAPKQAASASIAAPISAPEHAPSGRPSARIHEPSNGESAPPTSVSLMPVRSSVTVSRNAPRRWTLAPIAAGTVVVAIGAMGLALSIAPLRGVSLKALASPASLPQSAAPAVFSPSVTPSAPGSQATCEVPAPDAGPPCDAGLSAFKALP